MDKDTKSLIRDISLLCVGALISLLTSLLVDYFHEKRDIKKDQLTKKLELNYDISKALGNRFYLTYDLLQLKRSKDTNRVDNEIAQYIESRQHWNQNIYTYQAMLENYYGKETKNEFITKVYNPLANMGQYVEDRTTHTEEDTTLVPQALLIRNDIAKFIHNIYAQAENNSP